MKILSTIILTFILLIAGIPEKLTAQTFEKVSDPSNPINDTPPATNYSGAAWIDYNNDGLLDLFATRDQLFKNLGNGNFEKIVSDLGSNQLGNLGNGTTWGDVDNDGDLDCFIAGNTSLYYRNDGDDIFTPILDATLKPENDIRGWSAAFGDYNNDGFLDVVITHPAGFISFPATPSFLLKGNGDGRFTRVDDFEFSTILAPYTVPTWYDFDLDGDLDLFLASGPAGTAAPDYLYRNMLKETGIATLERIDDLAIGTDAQDGQVWNFIDYDNDGDLDAFLTNYGGASDRFYINEDGEYNLVSNALTQTGNHLANSWGDFDNDGDLDVVVTSETGNTFFVNENGNFTQTNTAFTKSGSTRGAVSGDYDNDGDLDLYFTGIQGEAQGLFKNTTSNGNNFAKFKLAGTVSNRSAIGATIKIKAMINGAPVWQIRQISGQNSFNSQNSMIAHFGLADATTIDSVVVRFPSGQTTVLENQDVNTLHEITEEVTTGFLQGNFSGDNVFGYGSLEVNFKDLSRFDPLSPVISREWDFNGDGNTDSQEKNPAFLYETTGNYTVSLKVSTALENQTIIRENYVSIEQLPGVPVILSYMPTFTDTLIDKKGSVNFSVEAEDTTGQNISYAWYLNSSPKVTTAQYQYRSSSLAPTPRTDTVSVIVSNGFSDKELSWLVHVDDLTGIDVEEGDIPEDYQLSQNYPNPFNPSTRIKFSLPETTDVSLKVYDVLGKQIANLLSGELNAGNYSVAFNASGLSGGIYFYSLITNSFRSTKKLVVLK
ncbi:MAG: hypothetical protein SCALA702_19980 [Melioribacteraceae bacterium]|nr:MAG: hypothetical protein SCALA702_19980 [Melioribacteraceae bacterium]